MLLFEKPINPPPSLSQFSSYPLCHNFATIPSQFVSKHTLHGPQETEKLKYKSINLPWYFFILMTMDTISQDFT